MYKFSVSLGTAAASCWEPRWRWADALSETLVNEEKVAELDTEATTAELAASPDCKSYKNCVEQMNDVHNLWQRLYSLKVRLDRINRLRKEFDKAGDVMERLGDLKQAYLSTADTFTKRK